MDSTSSFGGSGKMSPMYGRSRAQSISSDIPSTIGFGFVLPPLSVSPESCFIAHGAASQIITNDHDSHAHAWYDRNGIEPPVEAAAISGPALQLVNSFLDQLLFNFLQLAKSTRLSSLRLAIIEVLKPKLAQDAIGNAEEELKEYLGGADEEDYVQPQGPGASRNWDLELAWKRIRLRCMVYSSLGDMEEEDEDMYMEEENLAFGTNEKISDVVSPAVAIFLTSVLEYMGELTLTVAGQAAYHRVQNKINKELREGSRDASRPADRIVVADSDMERVALDRTLGRLWRGWKKRVRMPTNDMAAIAAGQPFSKPSSFLSKEEKEASGQETTEFQESAGHDHSSDSRQSQEHMELSSSVVEEYVEAAEIPLPATDNDVNEIEVPGLAHYSDDETDVDLIAEEVALKRPRSCVQLRSAGVANNAMAITATTRPQSQMRGSSASSLRRSSSVPTRPAPSFHLRARKHSRASASDSDGKARSAHVIHASGEKASGARAGARAKEEAEANAAKQVAAQDSPQSEEFEYEDAAEEFAFQKAEIVTSARVSRSISSYTVSSDSESNNSPYKKRASIHSARLIDVPRSSSSKSNSSISGSPAHSRTVSAAMDKSVHQSRLMGVSAGAIPATLPRAAAVPDERWKSSASEDAAGQGQSARKAPVPEASPAGSQIWPLQQNASFISEETVGMSMSGKAPEQSPNRVPNRNRDQPLADATAPRTAGSRTASPSTQSRQNGPPTKTNIKTPTYMYEQAPTKTAKAARLPATSATSVDRLGDLPRKASGHAAAKQIFKTESKELLTIERSRTNRESDEVSVAHQGSSTSTVRQIHTAASSVSSAASRLKPVRTSEDGSSRSDSVARNFEELIQSNETITYTLTPETMRDFDSKSPVVTKLPSRKTEDARSLNASKSSLLAAQSSSGPGSGRLPSPLLPSASSSYRAAEGSNVKTSTTNSKLSGPVSRAPAGLTLSMGRGAATAPREPRVPTDTTTDFANFIKATGPTDENKVYIAPRLAAAPPVSPGGSSVKNSRRASTASIISRLRYQPRDATVDGKADNSDLIDFIRQGPPIASTNHRIPRHVAPFRTTMDSDELSGAAGGRAVDASIPDIRDSMCSTNLTESSPSMHSSVNSKSALLRNKGASTMTSTMYGGGGGDDDMMPKRKTRRVRDPYAIDLSDEDEEEEEEEEDGRRGGRGLGGEEDIYRIQQSAKPMVKREESLAEFLRNYNPPAEPVSSPPRMPKKKASAPSLMARFSRSGGKDKDKDKASSSRGGQVASARGGYVPIKVSIPAGYDAYGPVDNKDYNNSSNLSAPAVTRTRGTSLTSHPTARVPMKKFEPRDAVASKTQTADLAAFLRDSAPPRDPSSVVNADRAPLHLEDESSSVGGSSIGKRFGRRKKSMAV
ncbi:hypothetical protein E4U55_000262 [Claviceps digitariae]|nr:hypothetical protein E4U55_000262 [Claviceps digitariae]